MPAFARSMLASSVSWSPGSTTRLKRAPSMPTKYTTMSSSSSAPMVSKLSSAAAWARASSISTPGITGRLGKWPWKNGSLMLTFLMARMCLPFSISSTRSTSRIG